MSQIILAGETQRDYALRFIAGLDISKKKFVVKVEPFVKKRSNPQLALYWQWLNIIAKETGDQQDSLHETFKEMFLVPVVIRALNRDRLSYSTSGLTAKDMSEYMGRVQTFANTDLGIFLPSPDDQLNR